MWRKIQFPTSSPAPVDLWTKEILLKQGALVRSLSLDLSKNCSEPEGLAECDPFYDNLVSEMQYGDQQSLSPKSVRDMINRCPNVSTLHISYELIRTPEDALAVSSFLSDLVPLMTNLKQLRQLSLVDRMGEGHMISFPSKLIHGLPLLESIKCYGLVVSTDQGELRDGSFGFDIAQLQNLSALQLIEIEGIDERWCLYNWPKKISDLTIYCCGDLSSSSAYRIIRHIAPCLTNLDLAFDQGNGSWEIDPEWNPGNRFSLPSMIDLKLCTRNPHLLDSFQDCISLECLEWTYITLERCQTLSGILFRATWPHLKKLVVDPIYYVDEDDRDPRDQEIEDELASLEKFCEHANIKAKIRRRRRQDD